MPKETYWMLFSLEGRVARQAYFLWLVGLWVVGAGVSILARLGFGPFKLLTLPLAAAAAVACSVGYVALGVKRCHDFNFSGHLLWVALIPGINFFLALALLFVPGTEGGNRFGDAAGPPRDKLSAGDR